MPRGCLPADLHNRVSLGQRHSSLKSRTALLNVNFTRAPINLSMSITFVKLHRLPQVARIRSTIPSSANDLTPVSTNSNSTALDPNKRLAVSDSERRHFSSWQGNQGVVRRRTWVPPRGWVGGLSRSLIEPAEASAAGAERLAARVCACGQILRGAGNPHYDRVRV